jgi:MerR family transcriptional regulator, copper efflux regulator
VKIGELADRAGVNVQTIRYYERRGLLPEPERTDSGYRNYGEADIRRLRFILRAKGLGFTLAEAGDLVDLRVDANRSAEEVRERALAKIEDTTARIEDLRRIRAALVRVVASCDAHGSPDECALMHAITDHLDEDTQPEEA